MNEIPPPAVEGVRDLPPAAAAVAFRADDATVVSEPRNGAAARVSFPGTVAVTEISGSESFDHVVTDAGLATLVCLVEGVHSFEPGQRVEARIDPARGFVFGKDGRRLSPPAAVPAPRDAVSA